jgi:hypothetical protein
MTARVQIARRRATETRWSLLAHGAAYERAHAETIKRDYEGRGDKIRFLPVGKENF